MTSFAAARTATSSVSLAGSAQRLSRPVASAGSSVARAFRSFGASADLHRGTSDLTFSMLMAGRD